MVCIRDAIIELLGIFQLQRIVFFPSNIVLPCDKLKKIISLALYMLFSLG